MSGRSYLQHGGRQNPRGSDAVSCDVFRSVGDDGGLTSFINGFNSAPSAASPNPSPLQYRLSVGPPNVCDYEWPDVDSRNIRQHPLDTITAVPVAIAILEYTDHQIEIIGDVDGVVPGDIVFVIPMEYRRPFDTPYKGHDNFGNYVACRLLSTGEFIYGVP